MPETPGEHKVNAIMARLTQEFIETARDQLEDVETLIDGLDSGHDIDDDSLFDIQRNIHNIKGQGATFGYPIIGRIAHLFEDYIENSGGVHRENVKDMRIYIEIMMSMLSTSSSLSVDETDVLLRQLPSGTPKSFSDQASHGVDVLLVMPNGVQRKLVAQELLSCGFNVNRAYNAIEALQAALDVAPDVVFVNNDIVPFNGCELARVFNNIERLKDTHFVLLTSYDHGDAHLAGLPDNVSVVEKRRDYKEALGELLLKWGVFGKIAS